MLKRLPLGTAVVLLVSLSTLLLGGYFIKAQRALQAALSEEHMRFLCTQFAHQSLLPLSQRNNMQLEQLGQTYMLDKDLALLKVLDSQGKIILNFEKNRESGEVYQEESKELLKTVGLNKEEWPLDYPSHYNGGQYLYWAYSLDQRWDQLFSTQFPLELELKPNKGKEEFGIVILGFDLQDEHRQALVDTTMGIILIVFVISLNLLVALKLRA